MQERNCPADRLVLTTGHEYYTIPSGGNNVEYMDIISFLSGKLQEIRNLSTTYVRSMKDTGSRNLIYSLIEQKKAHLAELEELSGNRELVQTVFPETETRAYLDSIGNFEDFSPDMEVGDFLRFIEKRLICFHKLYDFMSEHAPSNDTAYIFRRLEEEDKKEAALLHDRCDLLSLSM